MPVPFNTLKQVVKTEVTAEMKMQLQKMAMANKRSMRKQLEHIIEKAVKEYYGKENN